MLLNREMAKNEVIVKVSIENGFFVDCTDPIADVSLKRVHTNGWDCTIKEDGTIECVAKKIYNTETFLPDPNTIMYTIKHNGYAKLTFKAPGEPVEVLKRGYVIPKGMGLHSGMLCLSCAEEARKRYAYFEVTPEKEQTGFGTIEATAKRLNDAGKYGFLSIKKLVDTLQRIEPTLRLSYFPFESLTSIKVEHMDDFNPYNYCELANDAGFVKFETNEYQTFLHLKNLEFETVEDLQSYLREIGSTGNVLRFYPIVSLNYTTSTITVDVRYGHSKAAKYQNLLTAAFE